MSSRKSNQQPRNASTTQMTVSERNRKNHRHGVLDKKQQRFLRTLRRKYPPNKYYIPSFESTNGPLGRGSEAKLLLLFEKPGPKTDKSRGGSGKISQHNNDPTARATKSFLKKAGIKSRDIIIWNAISAWNKTIAITSRERKTAHEDLTRLINMLPKLQSIILVGKEAKKIARRIDLKNFYVFESLHPSPHNHARRPKLWSQIPTVWRRAKRSLRRKKFRVKKTRSSKLSPI